MKTTKPRDAGLPTKIGDYLPQTFKKGYNETMIKGLKNGSIFWTVKVDRYGYYDCSTQTEAEIISRLIRIEKRVQK